MKKWVCGCRWRKPQDMVIYGEIYFTVGVKIHTERCKKRTLAILAFKKQQERSAIHYQACEDAEYEEVAEFWYNERCRKESGK
jgi:hypothetical protein